MTFLGYAPPLTQRHSYSSTPAQDDPTFSAPRCARQASRRSISQAGGASLRRLFVKCELTLGGCKAAEHGSEYGLISAQHSRSVPGAGAFAAFARRFVASIVDAPYRLLCSGVASATVRGDRTSGGSRAGQHGSRPTPWLPAASRSKLAAQAIRLQSLADSIFRRPRCRAWGASWLLSWLHPTMAP